MSLRAGLPPAQRWLTVSDVARHAAANEPADAAPVLHAGDAGWTWRQIDEDASRLANLLLDNGLEPGSRVAVLLPNCGEYVAVMYGIARAGCVIVPLNSRYVATELEHALRFAEAGALITSPRFAAMAGAALEAVGAIPPERVWLLGGGDAPLGADLRAALDAASSEPPAVAVDEDDVYWMPFTSGTTGSPKAAMVSHRALIEQWRAVQHAFELTRSDTTLIAGPFYHSLGFLFGLSALYVGGRLVIEGEFEPASAIAAVQRHRVTLTPMVPTMYTMILADAAARQYDVSSMRAVISAGSPLLTGTKEGLLKFFPHAGLYEFYGSTEVGIVSVLRPEDQARKERCVGQPVLGCEVRLLGEDGREVARGEVGEVHKRGPLLGAAYFKSAEATAAMFRGDWAATGDLGRFDDEGYLYIVDRKKDMIISGGANIFPAEVEEVLSLHPGVNEVAVIGVPDDIWGERVTAVVVPTPGADVSADDLVEWCRARLANHMKPRAVEFVDAMPKTGSGKILKRELRARYWSSDDLQVH